MKKINYAFQVKQFFSALNYQWDDTFTCTGDQHDFWEMVYVAAGEVEIVEDDRIYHLHPGEMIFHAPMEFHAIRSSPQSAPHVLILSFSAVGEVPASLTNGIFSLSDAQRNGYESLFFRTRRFFYGEEQPYEGQCCATALALFLIELSRVESHTQLSEAPTAREYQSVVHVMRRGVCQNLTLTEVAERCHISVSYIKVLFQRYAGISPKAYYAKMRYDEAMRRLKGGQSIAAVSEAMNFSSPNYFSVFIKREAGLPLAKYLKQAQSPSDSHEM